MIDMQSDATDAIRATIDELERAIEAQQHLINDVEGWLGNDSAMQMRRDGIDLYRVKTQLKELKAQMTDWLAWHARQQRERPAPKPGRPTPLPEERPAPRKRGPSFGRGRDRK